MVVPYNKFLLKKYVCHINVEYCASIQSVKYLFDYLNKGSDRAFCEVKYVDSNKEQNFEVYNEINQYIDGRYLSPMIAAWRLQTFPITGRSHTVIHLAVHTENQQKLIFIENKEQDALNKWETTLTAWLKLNKFDEFARKIKYVNIPKYYVYNWEIKLWVKRQRCLNHDAIGRMNTVSPKDSERFHLKLILNRIKGATSFDDLKTYDGKLYQNYKDMALALGLIENDSNIFFIFEEACVIMLPYQLRKFFALFLLSENI